VNGLIDPERAFYTFVDLIIISSAIALLIALLIILAVILQAVFGRPKA
jgi:hypothetical protein